MSSSEVGVEDDLRGPESIRPSSARLVRDPGASAPALDSGSRKTHMCSSQSNRPALGGTASGYQESAWPRGNVWHTSGRPIGREHRTKLPLFAIELERGRPGVGRRNTDQVLGVSSNHASNVTGVWTTHTGAIAANTCETLAGLERCSVSFGDVALDEVRALVIF